MAAVRQTVMNGSITMRSATILGNSLCICVHIRFLSNFLGNETCVRNWNFCVSEIKVLYC